MSQAGSGASAVIIGEEEPSVRQISGVPTAVFGAVGVAERGPIATPTPVSSYDEYVRIYGNDTADTNLPHTARGFFEEGGQLMYVSRTVHYSNPADATTKTSTAATLDVNTGATSPGSGTVLGANVGPFALASGDTLVVDIDANGPATATFTAAAAARVSGAAPYALTNGMVLTMSINGGVVQTIAFLTGEFVSIGAATAAEVAAVINAKAIGVNATVTGGGTTVTITSDRRGTSSGVNVTGGTANAQLGYTTGNVAGTGNVADISAVTVAEVKTIVEAAVADSLVADAGGAVRISSVTTGGASSVHVVSTSTADDELGLDNAVHSGSTGAAAPTIRFDGRYDGAYANRISFRIGAASNGAATDFDLAILDDGRVVQNIPNLTMDSASARYVETIVNDAVLGSPLVIATDLALSGTVTERRPATATTGLMTGGGDGVVGIVDADYIGSSAGGTGFYAFDKISELRILSASGRATAAVHNAGLSYCEVWRKMSIFFVLDCPQGLTAVQMNDYVEVTASILESSEFGAIYWPRVKVLNPNRAIFGDVDQIVVHHSGIIAGVMARTDASSEGGVYQPPAGTERGIMRSVLGFETDEVLDERKRDLVYPKRINPLTTDRGLPRHIDGTRTLKSTGNFPSVSERRGVIFIEQSCKRGTEFARHSNNNPALRRRTERTIESFLLRQVPLGAFRSTDPALAFFVDIGDGLNTDPVVFSGQMYGRIGLATNKPNDWVILLFSQDTRALEAGLSGS